MKVLTIVGARPQFVKAAMLARELSGRAGVSHVLVHTGQHFDDNMSDVFFRQMGIPKPDYLLGIGGGAHGDMTGRMLQAIEPVLMKEKPEWVLVYGDTNSTLAGALAAVKLHIPVAHVEAGLRSFNRRMPEEINRVVTDHVSTLLLAPTRVAVENLDAEGIRGEKVVLTGDVMYDAVLAFKEQARRESRVLESLELAGARYVLATIHRAENTDDPARLKNVFEGLASMSEVLPVVIPLHPRTRGALRAQGIAERLPRSVHVIDPVGYLDMLALEASAAVICTDSGGVQKEAYFLEVPCMTLRDETEWVELVEAGANRLVPRAEAGGMREALEASMKVRVDGGRLYGDGRAAQKIAEAMVG